MTPTKTLRVRKATAADADFVISLVPRLVEFGPPSWRDPQQMIRTDAQVLAARLSDPPDDFAVLIAEDGNGERLGFIHVHSGKDHYHRDEHGHVEDLIVVPGEEGRGVGALLMEKGEEWARSRGYRWLSLNVFAGNGRARELYRRLGYGEDMIKCVKELSK